MYVYSNINVIDCKFLSYANLSLSMTFIYKIDHDIFENAMVITCVEKLIAQAITLCIIFCRSH